MKQHFSRFLTSEPGRLHVAAHSHHPWPDVSSAAHQAAWDDAARLHDAKWAHVLGAVVPEARRHVAARLGLPDPATVTFAPNTHEFVVRLLSCLPVHPHVLTTDGEFLSVDRQLRRLEEDGSLRVTRIPTEPFASFERRFAAAAARPHDLVLFSQVFHDSGFAVTDLTRIVAAVGDASTPVVIDGYHGFLAVPTDLGPIAGRAFYLAGGYKYAMAGEGAAFLHAPPGHAPRPPNTGWFAEPADATEQPAPDTADGAVPPVPYGTDATRFAGSTFDPSGIYRFNAVQRWLDAEAITVDAIHAHAVQLGERLLGLLGQHPATLLAGATPVVPAGVARGNFVTLRTPRAAEIRAALATRGVICNHRRDRLRFGFGIYHDESDVEDLVQRLGSLPTRAAPPGPGWRQPPGPGTLRA